MIFGIINGMFCMLQLLLVIANKRPNKEGKQRSIIGHLMIRIHLTGSQFRECIVKLTSRHKLLKDN